MIGTSCHQCTDVSQQGSTGCLNCTSTGSRINCTICATGYYLNETQMACIACSTTYPNSILCNATHAIQCQDDAHSTYTSRHYLVDNQCISNTNNCKDMLDSTGKCSSCYFSSSEGYYSLSSNGTCTLCSVSGCKTYSSTCQCLSCQDGYQFINNQCNSCQTLHCKVCQASVTECQTCIVAYGRLSSACQQCQPSNCYNCDGDNTVCAVCNTGYYLSSGQCYACQTNCQSCLSKTECNQCATNYYLQENGRCKTLPSNCISIDSTTLSSNVGSCKRCKYGYILLDGNCYPCAITLFNVVFVLLSSIFVVTITVRITTPS